MRRLILASEQVHIFSPDYLVALSFAKRQVTDKPSRRCLGNFCFWEHWSQPEDTIIPVVTDAEEVFWKLFARKSNRVFSEENKEKE
jgi:hypothetical protein